MKKILKAFIFVLLGVCSVTALVACNGKHVHEWTSYESDNTKHRGICEVDGEKSEWEAHVWGDWTVTVEPTEDSKGSRTHTCTICGKEVSEAIDELEPETGVATEVMAVYAQVPEDWETVNIYYWNNLTGEENTLEDEYKAVWPGPSMVEVDAEQHIWGFNIPVGVNMVIFNNEGVTQTVDIKLAMKRNLYVLSDEVNSDNQYSISYRAYTPKDSDPELPGAVATKIERMTVYAQVPADWEVVNLHYFGIEETTWPGTEMTKVEGDVENLYKIDNIIASSGIIINNKVGEDGVQTANLTILEGVNTFIVDALGGVTYGKYEDGELSLVEVDLPFPDVYVRGDMNSWGATNEYKLVVNEEVASIELSILAGKTFKIASTDYSTEFGYVDTLGEEFEASGTNIKCLVSGKYLIEINDINGTPTLSITKTGDSELEEEDHTITELYVVGDINDWTASDDYALTISDNTATIELTLEVNNEFKVFNGNWNDTWATFGYVEGLGDDFVNNGGNIKVVTAQTYIITISNLDSEPVLSIQVKAE